MDGSSDPPPAETCCKASQPVTNDACAAGGCSGPGHDTAQAPCCNAADTPPQAATNDACATGRCDDAAQTCCKADTPPPPPKPVRRRRARVRRQIPPEISEDPLLKSAIERNGDDREIRVVVGYAAVTTYDAETGERRREARARAWVDVEGKIVDACAPGTALCEAARRAGVDYDDESAMATEFGRETLDASGYAPSIDHSRALVVLAVTAVLVVA